MKYIYLMVFILSTLILSCNEETPYEPGKSLIDQTCQYDTDCFGNNYCNKSFNICSKINIESLQQCTNDLDCFDEQDISLCTDKTKPCKCSTGKCKTFNSCENDSCVLLKDEHKSMCSPTSQKPFYECLCDENYININGSCNFNCNEFGVKNSSNDGCDCNNNYIFKDNNCFFDCSNMENSHVNEANNDCVCDTGYKLVGNTCIYDCSIIPNSHPNEDNNDCVCNENYFPSANFCCQENSTYKTASQSCECNSGYHLDNNNCVPDTICSTNPCSQENEICVETDSNNYTCECIENYHRTGNICCQKFYSSNNAQGNLEECIPDYNFCVTDGDCTNGEVCTINKEENELIKYCKPKLTGENVKKQGVYCRKNEDCNSNNCLKYADDDNDETNGYDGYCLKLCEVIPETSPCDGVTCSNHGTCSVDEDFNTPKCTCNIGYKPMGTECKQVTLAQGNICGTSPELVISSSGIYETSNKVLDGYTNNYQASCNALSNNNESVFRLDLEIDSFVFIEVISDLDTVLYIRETCTGNDIVCSDDIVPSTVFRSKITTFLNKGTYYLFVDSMLGDHDVNQSIKFNVKITGNDKCPRGTSCTNSSVTLDGLNQNFDICKPRTKDSKIVTKCYSDSDCKNNYVCTYNPFNDTIKDHRTLGCVERTINCSSNFEESYSSGDYCCSNYSSDIDGVDICNAYCETTLDCPIAYDCSPFNIKDIITSELQYDSEFDETNTCMIKSNVCQNDSECTAPNKNFCTIRDNGDDRLYSSCSTRNGFTKDVGSNCTLAGYNNCYNYACLIPGEGDNEATGGTPYCTTTCKYDSNCPDGYTCQQGTLIYPENDDTSKTCKRTVDVGCINYNMNVCVKNP